jgi:hypothetical protein
MDDKLELIFSRAHILAGKTRKGGERRALLLVQVVVGKARLVKQMKKRQKPPGGHDSVCLHFYS